jgi:hypothetical protein
MQNYRRRLREIVYSAYGGQCSCCGESEQKFLSIDHINNDGYLDKSVRGIKPTAETLWLKIIRENFPLKYQILCFNCNIGKNLNNGICPHNNLITKNI